MLPNSSFGSRLSTSDFLKWEVNPMFTRGTLDLTFANDTFLEAGTPIKADGTAATGADDFAAFVLDGVVCRAGQQTTIPVVNNGLAVINAAVLPATFNTSGMEQYGFRFLTHGQEMLYPYNGASQVPPTPPSP